MKPNDRLQGVGRVTVPIKVLALSVFLANLFVGWKRVSVPITDGSEVHAISNGLCIWGLVAALFAIGTLAVALVERRRGDPGHQHEAAVVLLPLGLLLTTYLAVVGGGTNLDVAGAVRFDVVETLWPAWFALALAATVAAAYAIELLAALRLDRPHRLPPPAPA